MEYPITVVRCHYIQILTAIMAISGITAPLSRAEAPATQPKMEAWWADLEKSDPDASRALLNFSSHPAETVTFFKRKLRPLKIDTDMVEMLINQLGSNKPSEWKPAFEELECFDPRLAIDLPTLMDQVKQSPARQRLVEILSNQPMGSLAGKQVELRKVGGGHKPYYNFFNKEVGSWWAEVDISRLGTGHWEEKPTWTRIIRAIVLLEHIGTPDAVAIIKDMSTGNPAAQPTKVAKDALARLANR
jgi:hypothetical protein